MTYKEIKTILNTYIKYSNKRCGRVNDYHYNELEVFINLNKEKITEVSWMDMAGGFMCFFLQLEYDGYIYTYQVANHDGDESDTMIYSGYTIADWYNADESGDFSDMEDDAQFLYLRDSNYNQMASQSNIIETIKRQIAFNKVALKDYTNAEFEQPEQYIYQGHVEALESLLFSIKSDVIQLP